jgi:5,10-methenyltetrahydrofolate synthetase
LRRPFEEVRTWPVIERASRTKKRICAPMIRRHRLSGFREVRPETTLVTTDFGLQEPASGKAVTARERGLVITPLVVFNDASMRIGMAGGYYDRTHSFLRTRSARLRPKLVGLPSACQGAEKIPVNP